MMWALYKKELRYRVGALLALPALAALMWYYTWRTTASFEANGNMTANYEGLLDNRLAGWITLICAGVGFAFGLWQVLRETSPGPWAFLRHRPASAWRLYWAKFLAALTFYVLVTGLPLAGLVAWMATPNRLPIPWFWSMALPALMDFVGGAVYLLAGMLCAARGARWFGSRLFPVGLAVVGTMLTWSTPIWAGFLALGLTGAILLIAGGSALARRGREHSQPRFPRLLTAATLLPAMIGTLAAAIGLIVTLGAPSRAPQYRSDYQMRNEDLLLVSYSYGQPKYARVVDDNGNVFKEYPPINPEQGGYISNVMSYHLVIKTSTNFQYKYHPRMFAHYAYRIFGRNLAVGESWYYIPARGYIVGYHYDPLTNQTTFLGYIGVNGWNQEERTTERFHSSPYGSAFYTGFVVEEQRVFWVELSERRVDLVYTAESGESCFSAAVSAYNPTNARSWIVSTDRSIVVLRHPGEVLLRQPHPEGNYFWCMVGANMEQSRFGLLYTDKDWRVWQTPPLYLRIDTHGKELTRTLAPKLPPFVSSSPKWESQAYATITPSWLFVLSWCINPHKPPVPEMLACVLGTGMGIGITLWLLRRYQVGRKGMALWVGVNLLLGLSAVLLMLAVRHWPVRVACPHCGKRRAVNQSLCLACGKDFPAPHPGEVGVFDHAVAG